MAQAFAQQFALAYYTWAPGKEEERAQRLQPYLAQGLDQQAGVKMDSVQNSAQPRQTAIWKVEAQGKQRSVMTVMVELVLLPESQEEEPEQALTVKRWLSIPIQAVGNDRFIVRGLPHLMTEPVVAKVQLPPKQLKGQVVDGSQKKRIERTLQHFFDVYGRGDAAEIQYLVKIGKQIHGYRGAMEFVSLSDVEIRQQGKKVSVQGQVRWRESDTRIEWVTSFNVQLHQEQHRWYVTSLTWE